jgi:hypothetical protein
VKCGEAPGADGEIRGKIELSPVIAVDGPKISATDRSAIRDFYPEKT